MSETISINNLDDFINNLSEIVVSNLPLYYDSNFKYTVNISETDFIFEYKWNNIMEFWSLCVYDQNSTLLTSVKIVPDWNLYHNSQYRTDLKTPLLLSYNSSDTSKYPDQFSLSEEHTLSVTNIVFN